VTGSSATDSSSVTLDPGMEEVAVPERRPGDIAWLAVASIGVVLCALWSGANADVDENLCKAINGLGNGLEGLATAFTFLGSIWFVAIVVVLLLVIRWFPAARDIAIAAGGAWLLAIGMNALADTRSVSSLDVRTGDGPVFLTASVATATALLVAFAPYLPRPYRRLGILLVAFVAMSAVYLGTGLASDVIGGLFLGIVAGAAVHVAFGAPGGRPTASQLRDALDELGFDVTAIGHDLVQIPRATAVDVRTRDGSRLRALAFGRDQRDGQFFSKMWRSLAYKAPGVPVFGTRLQQVEHLAYGLLLAEQAGVRAPRLRKTGVAGPDAALLITDQMAGTALGDLGEGVTDSVLASAWEQLGKLHAAGVAHGALDATRLVVDDGQVAFFDPGASYIGTQAYWLQRDVATLLVVSAQLVGDDRAIAAALAALGRERLGEVIPYVQPATLPPAATKGRKHLGKALKQMRTDLTAATGVEDVPPLKVQRLTWINIGMLAGVLLAVAIGISSLQGIDWHSIQSELENAIWSWALLALILYPLVPMAWATALMGCVKKDLAFIPTTLVQLACSFLNLITPNGIGGTALQLDYLHHQDVPVATGGSAMVLSTGIGGAIQMILFVIAAAITATSLNSYDTGGSVTLGAIAVVAALIGVILWIPKVRDKVMPAAKQAGSDIWAVLRNPKKGAQLFGGDLAGNLIYPALLGLCLLAFHQSLDYAQLMVVQIGAGMLGNTAPVPGGIGVEEAGLMAGLTAFGIPTNPALAAVLVFRTITFLLPPVFGFFTLRRLRAEGIA
jgi:glycosyltransferase 2 family protein